MFVNFTLFFILSQGIIYCIKNKEFDRNHQITKIVTSFFWQVIDQVVTCHYLVLNPIKPRRTQVSPLTEFQFYFKKKSSKKIYKRRAYESVDEKSLSKVMSRKTTKKNFGP